MQTCALLVPRLYPEQATRRSRRGRPSGALPVAELKRQNARAAKRRYLGSEIGRASLLICALLACVASPARTQTACPHGNNDACDQWRFEQSERELSGVMAAAFLKIDQFASPESRQEARDALSQAHQTWTRVRALDCQAESAFVWRRSARTREGYTASCMDRLTVTRIETIRRRYLLVD
jgi:hypothetical protein